LRCFAEFILSVAEGLSTTTLIIKINFTKYWCIYIRAAKAEKEDHENIKKLLNVGLPGAPYQIKEDLEMENG